MNNVVELHQREKTPDDLLTIKEACRKYGYKYGNNKEKNKEKILFVKIS